MLTFETFICLLFFSPVSLFVCFKTFGVNILGGIAFRASGDDFLICAPNETRERQPSFPFSSFSYFHPRPLRKLGSQKVTMGKIIMGNINQKRFRKKRKN
jgi:hypothetical protein